MKKYFDIINKDKDQDNLYTKGIFQAIGNVTYLYMNILKNLKS